MKRIISYCTGGLGNRLRGLASCAVIAEESGRELKIYWDTLVPKACLAPLDELFENKLQTITSEELLKLEDYKMCVNQYDADRESWKFKNNTLSILSQKYGTAGKHSYVPHDNQENILVFNIEFLNGINLEKSHDFIRSLKPIKKIQENIDRDKKELGLNKGVIGIHARGIDFRNSNVSTYINQMKPYLQRNPKQKFFISTEDASYQEAIVREFPDNVLVRRKKEYVKKIDESVAWVETNFRRTKKLVQDAVEDMFLLSETSIEIYNDVSTFNELARILSKKK